MTRNEALRFGKTILMVADESADASTIEFTQLALRALEQPDLIQKIRQEVLTIPLTCTDGNQGNWYREPQAIIDDVLKIVDQYLGEAK